MGGFHSAISTRSTLPHVIFLYRVLLAFLLFSSAFQLSCSGCSEEATGKRTVTDTENILSDTATNSAPDTAPDTADSVDTGVASEADSVDTETADTAGSTDTIVDVSDSGEDKNSGMGIVSGGANISTNRFQMKVTVGAGAVATGQSANYQLNVGVGAQTTR